VWRNRNVGFGQDLLNCHNRVTERVIVMQRPVVLPFLMPFSPNTFAQTRQNFNVESSSMYEFVVHYSFITVLAAYTSSIIINNILLFVDIAASIIMLSTGLVFLSGG
jgi:hypothetical protein